MYTYSILYGILFVFQCRAGDITMCRFGKSSVRNALCNETGYSTLPVGTRLWSTQFTREKSYTGPQLYSDATVGSDFNIYYLYFNPFGIPSPGYQAAFVTPVATTDGNTAACARLYYNMNGADMGSFYIVVEHPSSASASSNLFLITEGSLLNTATRKEILIKKGDQGQDWISNTIDIQLTAAQPYYRVYFQVIKGGDDFSQFSFDDIQVTLGSCNSESNTKTEPITTAAATTASAATAPATTAPATTGLETTTAQTTAPETTATVGYGSTPIINNTDGDIVDGEKGNDVTLRWNIFDAPNMYAMAFYYNKIELSNLLGNVIIHHNKSLLLSNTNRISSGSCNFPDKRGTCEITISNLMYSDNGLYIVTGFFGSALLNQQKVLLDVKGGAELCGNQRLPQNFTSYTGEMIHSNVTLCGKPKPTVSWFSGDETIKNSIVEDISKDQHQYTYSFQIKTSSNMCGKKVSYYAAGFTNLSGFSLILFKKFTITDSLFTETAGCPILTWNADDHGLCDVDLVLSFKQNDNTALNVTVPVMIKQFDKCNYTLNSIGVAYQTIVYWNNNGRRIQTSNDEVPQYVALIKTTTTTATTTKTKTTTTTTSNTTTITTNTAPTTGITIATITNATDNVFDTSHKGSNTQETAAIVGASIGGVVFGIVSAAIVFIIWFRKGKTKENSNCNELKVRRNNNAADDAMTVNNRIKSNYTTDGYSTLAQLYDASNSTYTDLTKKEEENPYEVNEIVPQKPKQSNRDYEVMY